MKKIKDNGIKVIMNDIDRLKKLTKDYYAEEGEQGEQEELLYSISWKRIGTVAKLDLLSDLDIISIDEWSRMYELINEVS